ncbi:hypothetical protein GPJ56_010821 [Histomonas meleagridis]|uniref:uncharacterized protein n=1 Tax=Histomonas meleagridis TaxID=135588 RepID=UPI0035596076|nr:hypothetical protein GPJ56_010821 [Histomonas meleagridis]KAH0801158.1 hypothetical protein GO595_006193 [Histomonas meleagridis]
MMSSTMKDLHVKRGVEDFVIHNFLTAANKCNAILQHIQENGTRVPFEIENTYSSESVSIFVQFLNGENIPFEFDQQLNNELFDLAKKYQCPSLLRNLATNCSRTVELLLSEIENGLDTTLTENNLITFISLGDFDNLELLSSKVLSRIISKGIENQQIILPALIFFIQYASAHNILDANYDKILGNIEFTKESIQQLTDSPDFNCPPRIKLVSLVNSIEELLINFKSILPGREIKSEICDQICTDLTLAQAMLFNSLNEIVNARNEDRNGANQNSNQNRNQNSNQNNGNQNSNQNRNQNNNDASPNAGCGIRRYVEHNN